MSGDSAVEPSAADDDDDVVMTSEEVGVKCPYTQAVMKEPIRNKICNHNYEKMAIHEFIMRKQGNAKSVSPLCQSFINIINNRRTFIHEVILRLGIKIYLMFVQCYVFCCF